MSQSFFFNEVLGAMSSSLASSSSGSATESILFGSLAFVKASAFFAAITAYPPIFVLFFFLFLLSVLVFTSPVQKDVDITTDIIAKSIDYYLDIWFNSLWRAYSLIQPLEMILRCPVWNGYFQTQHHFLLFYFRTPWHCFLLQWPFSFCLEIYILIRWLISKQTHI